MFFSWCVLLFLASYGFSGAQSNHVALQYRGYGDAERDVDDYNHYSTDDHGFNEKGNDDPLDPYKNKELEKKKVSVGLATFIMGGITALLAMLSRSRGDGRRSEEQMLHTDDLKVQIEEKLKMAESALADLEEQVTGKQRKE